MPSTENRVSAAEAEYMELSGAKKDADCREVEVKGGVSSKLGCCDKFKPTQGTQEFRCGTCQYIQPEGKDYFFGG